MLEIKRMEKMNDRTLEVYYVASKDFFEGSGLDDKTELYLVKFDFDIGKLMNKFWYSFNGRFKEKGKICELNNLSPYAFTKPKIKETNNIFFKDDWLYLFVKEARNVIRGLYENYQLQTMIDNGWSVDRLIDEIQKTFEYLKKTEKDNEELDVNKAYVVWYEKYVFGGHLWFEELYWVLCEFDKWENKHGCFIPEEVFKYIKEMQ